MSQINLSLIASTFKLRFGLVSTRVIMGAPSGLSPGERQRVHLARQKNQEGRRTRPGGCLRSIASLIGLLILSAAFLLGFDYLVAPWAWGFFGRPTLTGEWIGEFRLPGGQRGAAYPNLTHYPNDDFTGSRLHRDLSRFIPPQSAINAMPSCAVRRGQRRQPGEGNSRSRRVAVRRCECRRGV